MKYSKAIRVAAMSLALSLALPGQAFAVVPEGAVVSGETPEEYQVRTGYQLPDGWHYVLENNSVILYGDGKPVIEADYVETEGPSETETSEKTEESKETEDVRETGSSKETEESEDSRETESSQETESVKETENTKAHTTGLTG